VVSRLVLLICSILIGDWDEFDWLKSGSFETDTRLAGGMAKIISNEVRGREQAVPRGFEPLLPP